MNAAGLSGLLAAAAVGVVAADRVGSRRGRLAPEPDRSSLPGSTDLGRVGSAPVRADHRHRSRGPRHQRPGALLLAGSLPAAVAVVGPLLVLALVASAGLVRVGWVRRARHQQQRARDAAFPDLVDLFRIAAAAGHPVHRCLEVVGPRAPAAVREALAVALARVQRGVPLADALDELGPDLGTSGAVLTDALQAALRTGSPLGPVLDRVVAVARDRRARSAQAAARRLPVTMVFPLVCCVLPAFGLLGVVPLLAGSLSSLAP